MSRHRSWVLLLLAAVCISAPLGDDESVTEAGPALPREIDASGAPRPLRATSIPPRRADALSGSAFASATMHMSGRDRQAAAVAQLESGNVPPFLRTMVPITLPGRPGRDGPAEAVIWVLPDYLSIGSDLDFLRMPMDLPSALEVAVRFGCSLPTTRMVDAIYAQASIHLSPYPLPPGPTMRSMPYYLRHRDAIEAQRAGEPLGPLIAGHKKDLVLTERLKARPGQVAIYGWHRSEGDPIQPLSTVHIARYTDYSHGVRLVRDRILVDGREMSLYDALADAEVAPLLSDEGPLPDAWDLLHGSSVQ